MKLLLRRDQRSGLLGKVVFSLDTRAQLSEEELSSVRRYKLGETEIYASHDPENRGKGLLGLAGRLAGREVTVTVNDLVNGKRIEAKDVVEMLLIEDHMKEAATTFVRVLAAAASFGGEEVVEI